MTTIVHMSDLHFGPPYVARVGEALLEATEAIQPELIVASGDFTQRAREEQFAEARAFLDRLPRVPTVVVPGNHDVPLWRVFERIFSPYRWYREYIRDELDYVLEVDGAVVVALNSTAPLRATTNGRIDAPQLDLCRRAFAEAAPGAVKIVVAHHHFAPAPDYEGGQVMPRAKRAIDVFTELEVDLIMGGHLHRAYIGNSLDLYPGADRDHGITIVQSGTSTSRRGRVREREKNSFNVVRVGDDVVRVTHYMYFEDVNGFASVSRHIFPRNHHRFFTDSVTLAGGGGGE
ncbi:MAG TPA: metallophosphoesterase family protein [Longimicrobiales bacterium]|nr:metallophosphoesterase family protein [Longimicrobiales bacterium]